VEDAVTKPSSYGAGYADAVAALRLNLQKLRRRYEAMFLEKILSVVCDECAAKIRAMDKSPVLSTPGHTLRSQV
jgi:hypothetical protein